jgi:AcrR family transcriptional regulator
VSDPLDLPVPPSVPISRDQVLRAALAIVDLDGVESLSMRRLGRVLGRDPMAAYRYADTKTALFDGVVELVLSDLTVASAAADWQSELREVARRFRAIAVAHPHVVPLLVTRPLATPLALRPHGTLRPLEATLALLVRSGFTDVDALHVYRLFFGFLYGHVLNELQELVDNPEETDDLLRLGLHRLPIKEFPLLRGLAPALASYDGATELERGLDTLLSGLQAQLAPSSIALVSSQ